MKMRLGGGEVVVGRCEEVKMRGGEVVKVK